jgi:hypothetical protein
MPNELVDRPWSACQRPTARRPYLCWSSVRARLAASPGRNISAPSTTTRTRRKDCKAPHLHHGNTNPAAAPDVAGIARIEPYTPMTQLPVRPGAGALQDGGSDP